MSRRSHFVLLVLWTLEVCVVAVGSLLPESAIPFKRLPSDKVLHFWGYFVAAALAPFAFERVRASVLIAAALIGLGIAIEYAQRAMSMGRSWDPYDIAANAVGVVAGLMLAVVVRGLFGRPREPADPL